MDERSQIEATIAALESQRGLLGDTVVETALAPLRQKLHALHQIQLHDQQRKQVTILFADLSGFTALADTMDAEEVFTLMNAVWECLDTVIEQHGGTIDKHIGDAVMALWGIPHAQENDVEQAIRAALAMHTALATFSAAKNIHLAMRIGINTGSVLLGIVGTNDEWTATGDAVSIANCLEQATPIHGTLISHETYRHVRGLFHVTPYDSLELKDKPPSVHTYLVEKERPRHFLLGTRGIEGVETRMIGRDRELAQLQETIMEVMRTQSLHVTTILGEAGIGKSRLLYAFRAWFELMPERFVLLAGRAAQELSNHPYGLIRNMLFFRFQIRENDAAAVACEKFIAGMATYLGSDEDIVTKAAILGYLIGLDFHDYTALSGMLDNPHQIKNRGMRAFADLVIAITHTDPVLLIAEDLHWADHASLDMLQWLVTECDKYPIYMLTLARPSFLQHYPKWNGAGATHHWNTLEPLTHIESCQLIEEILQHAQTIPEDVYTLITKRAEGNPFYVEEVIKMLLDDKVIIHDADCWHIVLERLSAIQVPSTLIGVLQARLDTLDSAEREALHYAAILGRTFWDTALVDLGYPEDRLAPTLATLQQRELIFRHELNRFHGVHEYVFKHPLLRDVVYEQILKRDRYNLHTQAAAWLIKATGDHVDSYARVIAEHYENAGAYQAAGIWYVHAGDHAYASCELAVSQQAYQKALDMLPHEAHQAILLRLGTVTERAGNWDDAEACYREALAFVSHTDLSAQAQCEYKLGRLSWLRGNNDAALKWLQQAWEHIIVTNDYAILSDVVCGLGIVYQRKGEINTASGYLEESLELARMLDDHQRIIRTLSKLGAVKVVQQEHVKARELLEECLDLASSIGIMEGQIAPNLILGDLAFEADALDQAQEFFNNALMIAEEIGDYRGMLLSQASLGGIYIKRQQFDQAWTIHQHTLAGFYKLGDKSCVAITLVMLADLMLQEDPNHVLVQQSACLQGAIVRLLESIPFVLDAVNQEILDRVMAKARGLLGDAVYEMYWMKGQKLSFEHVIQQAQTVLPTYTLCVEVS